MTHLTLGNNVFDRLAEAHHVFDRRFHFPDVGRICLFCLFSGSHLVARSQQRGCLGVGSKILRCTPNNDLCHALLLRLSEMLRHPRCAQGKGIPKATHASNSLSICLLNTTPPPVKNLAEAGNLFSKKCGVSRCLAPPLAR
jgi:hypothetical protein